MKWMISHDMNYLVTRQPLRYCFYFSKRDAAINISKNGRRCLTQLQCLKTPQGVDMARFLPTFYNRCIRRTLYLTDYRLRDIWCNKEY